MNKTIALVAFCILAVVPAGWSMTPQERKDYRDKLLQILPQVPAFRNFVQAKDPLPPDFDALPKNNLLPDPFKFLDGRPVNMPQDWPARRAEIRQLFEKYVLGTLPPKPTIDKVEVTNETNDNGFLVRTARLTFGPQGQGSLDVTVTIPGGAGPFPVLIAGQANSLLRRGYITCSYAGSVDQLTNLAQLYPEYDFASMGQRAWLAQLVVDYLFTLPQVDKAKIAITGYSRDGKMATIAAAMDERISAVIAGSAGVGGVLPWRFAGESGMGEGIESITRMFPIWFAPQFRFFAGREDRLPVDANLLIALVAPRAMMMEYGLNDEVSNTWGNEQTYHETLKVYEKLGQPQRLGILRVPGVHGANDMEACLDWLDIQFGRSSAKWDNSFVFKWNFDQWRQKSGDKVDLNAYPAHKADDLLTSSSGAPITTTADWEKKADEIRKAEQSMLGDAPFLPPAGARGRGGFAARGGRGGNARGAAPGAPAAGAASAPAGRGAAARGGPGGARGTPGQTTLSVPDWVIGRTTIQEFGWLPPERDETTYRKISFGYNVSGDLYYRTDTPADKKLPVVIWLHGYSYPIGYMWVYRVDLHPILALAKAGYAVLAFDQSGFGSRMTESAPFYDRYPHWSQMGRMVEDTRAAVDALQRDSQIDPEKIYLFGYSLGGAVALHTAALEPRVKGVVSISGFTPMRTDTPAKGVGANTRLGVERGIIPRLGLFSGNKSKIPYDFHELVAAIAPRPVYIFQAENDRDADASDVRTAIEQAKKVYGLYNANDKLIFDQPWDYGRLPTAAQNRIIKWMGENLH